MSEIEVGDVLAWEARLTWSGDSSELSRPLSWVVTIHPRIPALPPMRGNELIVVTQQTLIHLRRMEMVSWADITRLLSAQPVAGLVVDGDFDQIPIPGVPVLRAANGFPPDAEAYLNRTITERRGELYRLGSDLSRALSTASIAGADLDALLAVAGDVGRSDLMLFDRAGSVLGGSRSSPDALPFAHGQIEERADTLISIDTDTGRWLVERLHSPAHGSLYLALTSGVPGAPEIARLVLSQTARAIETFLGRLSDRRPLGNGPSRESLLADLMLGRVTRDRVAGQSRVLGIDPSAPSYVALCVSSQTEALARLRRRLPRDIQNLATTLPGGELAMLLGSEGSWDDLRKVLDRDDAVGLIRSERLADVPRAAAQARTLGRLWLQGLISGQTVDAGDLGAAGLLSLLLPLLEPRVFEPKAEQMTDIVTGLLGALEAHDDERGSDLLQTLAGYLAAGGSTTGAAALLGVHRNTLAYRLTRIGELTGGNLDDADTRLALGLALKIRQLQRALDSV